MTESQALKQKREVAALEEFKRLPAHILLVGGTPYVELPSRHGEGEKFSLARVFTNLYDVSRYKSYVCQNERIEQPSTVTVATFGDPKDLFLKLAVSDTVSLKLFEIPLRVVLCQMREREHPETVSVLWCPQSQRH